jgi:hypothetical protein
MVMTSYWAFFHNYMNMDSNSKCFELRLNVHNQIYGVKKKSKILPLNN